MVPKVLLNHEHVCIPHCHLSFRFRIYHIEMNLNDLNFNMFNLFKVTLTLNSKKYNILTCKDPRCTNLVQVIAQHLSFLLFCHSSYINKRGWFQRANLKKKNLYLHHIPRAKFVTLWALQGRIGIFFWGFRSPRFFPKWKSPNMKLKRQSYVYEQILQGLKRVIGWFDYSK